MSGVSSLNIVENLPPGSPPWRVLVMQSFPSIQAGGPSIMSLTFPQNVTTYSQQSGSILLSRSTDQAREWPFEAQLA